MKALLFAFAVVLACGDVLAQTNVWAPSPGHDQMRIWPGAVPDAHSLPGPEYVTTVTNLVAGRGQPRGQEMEDGRRENGKANAEKLRGKVEG